MGKIVRKGTTYLGSALLALKMSMLFLRRSDFDKSVIELKQLNRLVYISLRADVSGATAVIKYE